MRDRLLNPDAFLLRPILPQYMARYLTTARHKKTKTQNNTTRPTPRAGKHYIIKEARTPQFIMWLVIIEERVRAPLYSGNA